LPEPRDGFGITVVNGKIYVVGGFSGPAVTSTVYVYDPKSDAWSTSTEFPSMKNGSAGCAAIKKKIFVIGGCEKNYVPNSNTFEGVVIKNRRTNKQRSS
jgi:N-acetylneuraminic acid mutarotase